MESLAAPTLGPGRRTAQFAHRVGTFLLVPGEFFLMALGGLGVSLAGFVGIITALDRREDARSEVSLWRVRNIVRAGFTLTLIGFGTVAVYPLTGDDTELTIGLASVFAVLASLVRLRAEFRPGPAWPDEGRRRTAVLIEFVGIIGFLISAVVGSVGLFQVLLVYQLGFPLSIFFFTIRDAAGGGGARA